ncbi:hypothetical protein FOCC_FOCC014544, partial [Frankliniella occidentalis]
YSASLPRVTVQQDSSSNPIRSLNSSHESRFGVPCCRRGRGDGCPAARLWDWHPLRRLLRRRLRWWLWWLPTPPPPPRLLPRPPPSPPRRRPLRAPPWGTRRRRSLPRWSRGWRSPPRWRRSLPPRLREDSMTTDTSLNNLLC